MSCREADLKVGDMRPMVFWYKAVTVNPLTGKKTEVFIDLGGATQIRALCTFTSSAGVKTEIQRTLTPDPDQVANKGKASFKWGATDLIAGKLSIELEYRDAAGDLHPLPYTIELEVAARLQAA